MADNTESTDPLVSSGASNTPQRGPAENAVSSKREIPQWNFQGRNTESSVEAMPEGSWAFKNFCSQLGINQRLYAKISKNGIYAEIQSAAQIQLLWWWFWTVLAVALVLAQLILGLTVSVLTSLNPKGHQTAVIILGAAQSAVGGIAALLQYRGQPARSGRYSQALEDLKNDVEAEVGHFRGDNDYAGSEKLTADVLIKRFQSARKEALSNDPLIYSRIVPASSTSPNAPHGQQA